MAQIVISHASTTELTPQELLKEIKEVYSLLASMEAEAAARLPRSGFGSASGPGDLAK